MKYFSYQYVLKLLPLLLVLLLFLVTRLYQINSIPTSLYWDEASIGYNAYSIISTGKDEWGKAFPLNFRAFGEFKLPTYIYSVGIFEEILGVNELAVRLPAVLYSLGIVIVTFLLTLRLIPKKWLATLASLFLITSPWFFIFSRVGYEATAGLFFFMLGIYLLTFWEKKYLLIFSTIAFVLSMYSYNSFRVVTPLTIGVVAFYSLLVQREKLLKWKWVIVISLVLFLLSIVPIIHSYLSDTGAARFNTVSILTESSSKVELVKIFIGNYFSHFSPDFLFLKGDIQTRMQQGGWGELFIVELPFLFLGLVEVFRKKERWLQFLLLLVFIAPIPAAITRESPHSLRSVTAIPFLSIIAALGVESFLRLIKGRFLKYMFVEGIVVLLILSFGFYFKVFITTYNLKYSQDWQYAYKRVFTNYQSLFPMAGRVLVSDNFSQPYIYALFYLKYSPNSFRQTVNYNSPSDWGFSTVSSFDKFVFPKQVNLAKIERKGDLVFSSQEEIGNKNKQVGRIDFLNGSPALWIYQL